MILFTSPDEWKQLKSKYFGDQLQLGFVPTMGALHEGHQSLFRRAAEENDICLGSIFVNPTQFNQTADLQAYPRTLEADMRSASTAGCDALFVPEVGAMYGENSPKAAVYDYGELTSSLEGAFRPGHFDGVITIVKKFVEALQPDRMYLGEKDFQQLSVLREMVRREGFATEIVGCELIRSADGLALSSRNTRLSENGKSIALNGYKVLKHMQSHASKRSLEELKAEGRQVLSEVEGIELEYLEVVREDDFSPAKGEPGEGPSRALLAFYVEGVRLIDNLRLTD